jgi:hypothetical protein
MKQVKDFAPGDKRIHARGVKLHKNEKNHEVESEELRCHLSANALRGPQCESR